MSDRADRIVARAKDHAAADRRAARREVVLGAIGGILLVSVSAFAGAAIQAITGLLPW